MKIEQKSLNLRRNIHGIIQETDEDVINLQQVEFISRAVADEIYNNIKENDLKVINASNDVKEMLLIVCDSEASQNIINS